MIAETRVAADASGMRLVDYAKAHLVVLAVPAVGPVIEAGAVTIDGRAGRINDRLVGGEVLGVDVDAIASIAMAAEAVALAVHHEDEAMIVVDKPCGMHVHPMGPYRSGTLLNALLHRAGARADQPWAAWRPHPVHRLDRPASGLVAIAKTAASHDRLRVELEAHALERRYRAVVHGVVADDAGVIDAPLGRDPSFDYRRAVVAVADGGQLARTHYRVIARGPATTTLELALATGRTHQIRVHLASLGHPIVGDSLYLDGMPALAIELRAISLAGDGFRVELPA